MDKVLAEKLLLAQKKRGKPFEITVTGVSMKPTLFEGDTITIQTQETYDIGDILVFRYKQGGLLVHRLLLAKDEKYYCKGDNSFRLEDVTSEQILGKVIAVNGKEVSLCRQRLIVLSYAVNKKFRKHAYNIEKTKRTDVYKLYEKVILQKGENIMIYQKNKEMDYISVDETSLTVFDPATGDAHFFDAAGIDILNILDEPSDLDVLLANLCEIYDAVPKDIKTDVEEFLADVVSKKVVIEL